MGCWALVGRQGQHESWAGSDGCYKEYWENPHRGGESIPVARATALPRFSTHSVLDSLPPPSCRGSTSKEGGAGHTATLDFAAKGKPGWAGAVLSLQHPLEGPQALLASLGDTWAPCRSLGAATHSEFRERRPWKASGAISAIWLLLRSLHSEQERGWLNPSAATKPCLVPQPPRCHGRAGASGTLDK